MKSGYLAFILNILLVSTALSAGPKVLGPPRQLIGIEGEYFMHPIWSPDGAQIAFTSTNYQGLWVIQADGRKLREITTEAAAGYGFEWSHDSKALLSRVAKYENQRRLNALKIFDLEQQTSRLLTEYRSYMPGLPHWSQADEKVFIFNRKLEIFAAGRQASTLQKAPRLTENYFLKGDQIAVYQESQPALQVLEPIQDAQCLNLVVSPDGNYLAFEILGGNLYVIHRDGTGLTDLGAGHRPQWAPDNVHLVYMQTTDDGMNYLSSDLFSIRRDGQEKTPLTATTDHLEMNPHWSPDGSKIVFDRFDEGAIYLLDLSF